MGKTGHSNAPEITETIASEIGNVELADVTLEEWISFCHMTSEGF